MNRSPKPSANGGPSELESRLRDLGKSDHAGSPRGEHVEPEPLAAWLDHQLGEEESAELELHLATCGECRALARDAAAALTAASIPDLASETAPEEAAEEFARLPPLRHPGAAAGVQVSSRERPRRSSRVGIRVGPRGRLAAAVLLAGVALVVMAALVAGVGRIRSVDPRLASLGVGMEQALFTDRQLLDAASAALDGDWPQVPPLDALPAPAATATARGPEPDAAPIPLVPRWESTTDTRPTFRWRIADGVEEGAEEERFELLLLDADDRLAGRWEVRGGTGPAKGARRAELPPDVELEPGAVYAWKVNRLDAEGWPVASPYVPFRVLGEAEAEALERRLRAESSALLRAVLWAEAGAYGPARAELAKLPGPEDLRQRLLEPLRRRQHLPPGGGPGAERQAEPADGESERP